MRCDCVLRGQGADHSIFAAIKLFIFLCSVPVLTSTAARAGLNSWTGNGPEGGNIDAIAIDPVTPATLYVGTWGGGVYMAENGIYKTGEKGARRISDLVFKDVHMLTDSVSKKPQGCTADITEQGEHKGRHEIPGDTFMSRTMFQSFAGKFRGAITAQENNDDNMEALRMDFTEHAQKQAQRRAIDPGIVDFIVDHGEQTHSGSGCRRYRISREALKSLKQECPPLFWKRYRDQLHRISSVVSSDRKGMTGMHRHRPLGR